MPTFSRRWNVCRYDDDDVAGDDAFAAELDAKTLAVAVVRSLNYLVLLCDKTWLLGLK